MNIIVILQEPLSASHIPYVWFPRGYPPRANCSSYPRFEEFQYETDSKEHLFCKISKNSICVLKCLTKYFISLKNISDPPFIIWKNLLIPPFDLRKSTWSPQFSGTPLPVKNDTSLKGGGGSGRPPTDNFWTVSFTPTNYISLEREFHSE